MGIFSFLDHFGDSFNADFSDEGILFGALAEIESHEKNILLVH